MKKHTRLFEDFSYPEEKVHVIDLVKQGEKYPTSFVFLDKNDAVVMLDEINKDNPNIARARLTQTVKFAKRHYFDTLPIKVSDITDFYDSLDQYEKYLVDTMVFHEAKRLGDMIADDEPGFPKHIPIRYMLTRTEETLGNMIRYFRETLEQFGLDETMKRFGNRIDWIPANVLRSIHKESKTKRLFGI
jgi:hypothetical protein